MSAAKLQDKRSKYKKQLHFYIQTMNNSKKKLREQSHLQYIQKD